MLLLIFLTVVISGCATNAPRPPNVPVFQPIVNLNLCKEWHYNESTKEWDKIADHELSKCHGIFGVTSPDATKMRDYGRKLESWIGLNCGAAVNGQPQATTQK